MLEFYIWIVSVLSLKIEAIKCWKQIPFRWISQLTEFCMKKKNTLGIHQGILIQQITNKTSV